VTLDDDGRELDRRRTRPFFDPSTDPVTEKAVRTGDTWIFVSFAGIVHPLDVSGPEIVAGEPWSLLDDADRKEHWLPGGLQHLAVHEASGRLFSLMHRGGPDTHKEPGDEVWVYDLATHRRVQRIELVNPGITFMGYPIELPGRWRWLSDWILDTFVPAMVGQIQVTQDGAPLLFTASQYFGSLGVYDATDGSFRGRVEGIGMTTDLLQAPGGRRGER
jgi:methylamine dehydrogenase heavy chain